MSNITFQSLVKENAILRKEISQIRYFLAGSRIDLKLVSDVELGQSIYCEKDAIHGLAAGFLRPAKTCLDIGPGVRPQRLLDCPVHVLVEPHLPYAERLLTTFPEKQVHCADGLTSLRTALSNSVDTIFLLDVIEHLDKAEGSELLKQARRVARGQVVVFTPLGFMPQHYSDSPEWDGLAHSELQNHRSGWMPGEFSDAVHVVCENYHRVGDKIYGAFYSIIDASASHQPRLVLVSEGGGAGFEFREGDLILADVVFSELSWNINVVPKRNITIVPLQLIAEEGGTPLEILRNSIVNFSVLEHYLERFKEVVPLGNAARVVHQRHMNGWT